MFGIQTSGGGGGAKWIGPWVTGTVYALNNQVGNNGDLFICILGHTAGATNEPGVGAQWETYWARQVDMLTADQVAALGGTGTPSANNKFVTADTDSAPFSTSSGHDHDGSDSKKVGYASLDGVPSSFTPASHTLGSHTTTADAGKVLTSGADNSFSWADPAPTWDQVSSKPSTFAPIIGSGAGDAVAGNDSRLADARTPSSHTLGSHTTTAEAGKVLTSGADNSFSWADPAPTWGQVSSKPSTFAPVVGTGATDACAGNDSRLADSRTPTAHGSGAHTGTIGSAADISAGTFPSGTFGFTDAQVFALKTKEVVPTFSSGAATLASGDCANTIVSNYNQGEASTITLPAAASGLALLVIVTTTGYALNVKAGANDKIYLNGTPLDDGDKVSLSTPAVGNCAAFFCFKNGASAYDWFCNTLFGSWVDGGA